MKNDSVKQKNLQIFSNSDETFSKAEASTAYTRGYGTGKSGTDKNATNQPMNSPSISLTNSQYFRSKKLERERELQNVNGSFAMNSD